MDRPDRGAGPRRGVDWRGWLAVAWLAWFGYLYVLTVLECRGGAIRALLAETIADRTG